MDAAFGARVGLFFVFAGRRETLYRLDAKSPGSKAADRSVRPTLTIKPEASSCLYGILPITLGSILATSL